jgi:nickel-dependent lactate racemase
MVTGRGSVDTVLKENEIEGIIDKGTPRKLYENKRVLVITPDASRTAPLPIMVRVIDKVIGKSAKQLDFIVALGSHKSLSDEEIINLYGLEEGEKDTLFNKSQFFNHRWDLLDTFVKIGEISKNETQELTAGLLSESIEIVINRVVYEYDLIVILGPVFPHVIAGFSGGNKYFFPGISGGEFLHLSHWLGALLTNVEIIGRINTPTRRIIDRAASFIDKEKLCISMVVKSRSELAGLFIGSPEESWSEAADLSSRVHIVYKNHPYKLLIGTAPIMYNELWSAGKVMYKLEPVVEDGGELIIYGPHIDQTSHTWGSYIERIGYHVRDYFIDRMDHFSNMPKAVLAHSTHVKGAGTYSNGYEQPRINVTLATSIPETLCRKTNLGYRNPDELQISDYKNRENEGILLIENAGETLYRLKD